MKRSANHRVVGVKYLYTIHVTHAIANKSQHLTFWATPANVQSHREYTDVNKTILKNWTCSQKEL